MHCVAHVAISLPSPRRNLTHFRICIRKEDYFVGWVKGATDIETSRFETENKGVVLEK